jgi:hypothetical protein
MPTPATDLVAARYQFTGQKYSIFVSFQKHFLCRFLFNFYSVSRFKPGVV